MVSRQLALVVALSALGVAQSPETEKPGSASGKVVTLPFEFEKPFRLEANGAPIAADMGHAAPFVIDMDGDGVKDLVVGQFGPGGKAPSAGTGGRCRIYRNLGTNAAPKFGDFEWLTVDGVPAAMESS